MDIKGKTIVITGGGQGLGRAMAVYLAGSGASLALIDLNAEKLAETAGLCRAAGGSAHTYLANVAREEEVVATFERIVADTGAVRRLTHIKHVLQVPIRERIA